MSHVQYRDRSLCTVDTLLGTGINKRCRRGYILSTKDIAMIAES